jgi:hydroxyethylthiazole kinase-like uncharacterized protein yjeF
MTDPREITPELLGSWALPQPDAEADKDARGRVLVVAGSLQLPGAAVLAGLAALRSGAGKLQVGTCSSLAIPIGMALLEAFVMSLPETPDGGVSPDAADQLKPRASRCDAILVGPGMVGDDDVFALADRLLADAGQAAFVLDAAALTRALDLCDRLKSLDGRVVVTPHAGEMATLLDVEKAEVEREPLPTARRAAERLGAVVALKGAETHIVSPDGRAWINRSGSKGLATSGSGDTLAGLIAGLLARGADPAQAAVWGVHVHAEAGRALAETVGPLGFLARELPAQFPALLNSA